VLFRSLVVCETSNVSPMGKCSVAFVAVLLVAAPWSALCIRKKGKLNPQSAATSASVTQAWPEDEPEANAKPNSEDEGSRDKAKDEGSPSPAKRKTAAIKVACLSQCIGTDPSDTRFDKDDKACKREGEVSWAECKWPTASEFASIGLGYNFNFSLATASGYLRGIADFSSEEQDGALPHGLQVLTDLDDTIVCSGGLKPAGVDKVCEGTSKGGIYPGVMEFQYALALGLKEQVVWGTTRAKMAIPFSARPRWSKKIIGVKRCSGPNFEFRKHICGCPNREACIKQSHSANCNCFGLNKNLAQYGYAADAKGQFTGDFIDMGVRKWMNWRGMRNQMQKLAVFVGDDGQGDLHAAQMMLLESQKCKLGEMIPAVVGKCRGAVVAAFIHDVARKCTFKECREAWAKHNVFFFANYLEAAHIAADHSIISKTSFDQVASGYNDVLAQPRKKVTRDLKNVTKGFMSKIKGMKGIRHLF